MPLKRLWASRLANERRVTGATINHLCPRAMDDEGAISWFFPSGANPSGSRKEARQATKRDCAGSRAFCATNPRCGAAGEACAGNRINGQSSTDLTRMSGGFFAARGAHRASKFGRKFRTPALSETTRGFPPYGCPDAQEPPWASAAHSLSSKGMLGATLSSKGRRK